MYVVSRKDLAPGYQIAQSAHAIADFTIKHPQLAAEWHKESNYIVCLSAKDESELCHLAYTLESRGIPFIQFIEPDLGNQTTSIAAYGEEAGKLFSNLPLALKELGRQQTVKEI